MMMQLEWMLNPIAYYAQSTVGLGLCLHLFLSLKSELRKAERRAVEKQRALEELVRQLAAELAETRQQQRETEERMESTRPRGTINLSKRSQAMRMYRRGETSECIAAAMGVPRTEVDLLLKVQRLICS